ncbi:MAG: hypothetical protein ACR2FM_02585 [Candidatus Saccharimonadales bacterium]
MAINLEQPLSNEFEPQRTTDSRSFFIVENQPAGSELYERTQEVLAWKPEIGVPSLYLNDIPGINHASITIGHDTDDKTAVLQLLVRDEKEAKILHGQVNESSERWQLASVDNQGRITQEATIWDSQPHGLSAFVCGAIVQANVVPAASNLLTQRAAAKKKYEEYRDSGCEESKSSYWSSKLAIKHSTIGFSSSSFSTLQHMIVPHKDQLSRWHNIDRLPNVVKKLLAAPDYEVIVK